MMDMYDYFETFWEITQIPQVEYLPDLYYVQLENFLMLLPECC